jgi:putative ABC transport system permease protein
VPAAHVSAVVGVNPQPYWDIGLKGHAVPANYTSTLRTPVLVGNGREAWLRPLLAASLTQGQVDRAIAALGQGRVVVFTDRPDPASSMRLTIGSGHRAQTSRLAATYVDVVDSGTGTAPSQAVVPPSVLHQLGRPATTAGLLLTGGSLSRVQESRLGEVLFGIDRNSYLYVERGYQTPGSEKVVLWILFALAGVLMLGGTLTATFLALSDARPDLATLSAVGAAPRTRRGVAAAYAVSVGVVGAALGSVVGFIPGIAVSYPLTRTYAETGPSHYLAIPWLLIVGLVVALPLLTALVVGLTARSRLPLVARLE